jgi:hypothetical protein
VGYGIHFVHVFVCLLLLILSFQFILLVVICLLLISIDFDVYIVGSAFTISAKGALSYLVNPLVDFAGANEKYKIDAISSDPTRPIFVTPYYKNSWENEGHLMRFRDPGLRCNLPLLPLLVCSCCCCCCCCWVSVSVFSFLFFLSFLSSLGFGFVLDSVGNSFGAYLFTRSKNEKLSESF